MGDEGSASDNRIRPDLAVVIPVYNEQLSVRKVIREWFHEIENWTENFVIIIIDDGSTDRTPELIQRLQEEFGARIELHSHSNRGHGASCIVGYERALELGAQYVFQIDSDGQCDPQFFFRLWRMRKSCDVLYGWRRRRDDGWRRTAASLVLRFVLLMVCGVWCVDPNTPYRMMRTEVLRDPLAHLRSHPVHLSNVALAVRLRLAGLSHGSVPIRFRERYGGEPLVGLGQFGAKARELVRELRAE